jgi:hypothetical protein
MFRVALVLSALSLVGCGGGGTAGDVAVMSVIPGSYSGTCALGATGLSFEVVHSINGGQAPFRVRSHGSNVTIGYASPTNEFVEPPASAFNSQGDLVLNGNVPKFAVRYIGLSCGSTADAAVTVFDLYNNPVSPSYTADEADSGT